MKPLSRRTFLRGTGAAIALPFLERMGPAAGDARPFDAAQHQPPVRLFLYIVGGGAYLPFWSIDDAGRKAELDPKKSVEYLGPSGEKNQPLDVLSPSLEPLEKVKKELLVFGGLTLSNAHGFEDGHSAEIGALLTGATFARDKVECSISIDQLAARHFEGKTPLDALVAGLHGGRPGGAKGIGRVYAQHYSWRTPTTPTGEERNPRLLFDRVFRGPQSRGASDADRRSVLDSALDEAKRLQSDLGGADRAKLDEYLTSVRDVEKRIEFASKRAPDPAAPAFDTGGFEKRLPAE